MPVEVSIPGRRRPLVIRRVVFDFNGTLAVEGRLIRGVAPRLRKLAALADVIVMTSDTFGTARKALESLPVSVRIVSTGAEKRRFVESVGPDSTVAVGNGTNDVPMFKAAALGVAVLEGEGAAGELLLAAAAAVRSINDALDLLLKPRMLAATLRR
jgi:P-type E1-E2 ATPase